jgi:hypothetical protein
MTISAENIAIVISILTGVIFIGSFYGTTKKKLAEIEYELKEAKTDKYEIIDKLARIETKLDFLSTK